MFKVGDEVFTDERITRMIGIVSEYLQEMGQPVIDLSSEAALCERILREQLEGAWEYGHIIWDGYDVADEIRSLRQQSVHVVTDNAKAFEKPAIIAPQRKTGDIVDVTFSGHTERMRIIDGPFRTDAYGWAFQVVPLNGQGSVIVPDARVLPISFKEGDTVRETNFGHIGVIVAPGDDNDFVIRFDVDGKQAYAQLGPDRLQHIGE